MTVVNQKSLALHIKGLIGHRAWRMATRPVAFALRRVPPALLYRAGLGLRRKSWPYSAVREGDTVVQVGAPGDLVKVGRSRAVFFALLVGESGHLHVFEPEPASAAVLEACLTSLGLMDRVTVHRSGCWDEARVLRFWANPDHPASNLLEDVSEWDETELRARGYLPSEVTVVPIDAALSDTAHVRLMSVTTNGSEERILAGAVQTLGRTQFLALADTGPGIRALSERFGFRNVAMDDRGFTAERLGA